MTRGIRAQGSNTSTWWSSNCLYGTVNLNHFADVVFFEWYKQRNLFLSLTTGMERLEEYAEEESPYTEKDNLQREPIQEDITTNSSELLQIVKELKSEMEFVKKENERISESSGRAESNSNRNISYWGKG